MPIPEAIAQKNDAWKSLRENYSEDRTNVSEKPKFEKALRLLIDQFENYANYLKPFYDQELMPPGEEREDFEAINEILDHLLKWVIGVVEATRAWGGRNHEWKILSETIKKSYVDPKYDPNLRYAWSTTRHILKIFNKRKDEDNNYSLHHFDLISYLKELTRDLNETGFVIKDTLARYYFETASFYVGTGDESKAMSYLHSYIKLGSTYLAKALSDRNLRDICSSQKFQEILKKQAASDRDLRQKPQKHKFQDSG